MVEYKRERFSFSEPLAIRVTSWSIGGREAPRASTPKDACRIGLHIGDQNSTNLLGRPTRAAPEAEPHPPRLRRRRRTFRSLPQTTRRATHAAALSATAAAP
jgi:hypothetical protein